MAQRAGAGDAPCSKNITFSGLSPKYALVLKNSSVSRRVGPLVMMYHGTTTERSGLPASSCASCCRRAMRSA